MKAQMKKIAILAFHKEREQLTDMLRELGVIHVSVDQNFRDERIDELDKRMQQLNKAIEAIEEARDGDHLAAATAEVPEDVDRIVEQVLALKLRIDSNYHQLEVLTKQRLALTPWDHFDRDRLEGLKEYGIHVGFYVANKREWQQFPHEEIEAHLIQVAGGRYYFVVLSDGPLADLPFDRIQLPDVSLQEVLDADRANVEERKTIQEMILQYSPCLPILREALLKVKEEILYFQANGSYEEHREGAILSLTGWFPNSIQGRLEHYLNDAKATYVVADPEPGDEVPVMLRNRRYPKIFETITRIFQLPNYYELDLTPWIAVFYPIFFAYCLGDAGYGLILLIASIVSWFTFLKDGRNLAVLGIILGLMTTIMGVIKSGSIFGIPFDGSENPILQYLAQFVIIPDDQDYVFNAFNVALMIGVVQIIVGILLCITNRLIYQRPVDAIQPLGKLLIVGSAISLFLMGDGPGSQNYVLIAQGTLILGVLLVLTFHNMELSLAKRIPAGILPLFFIFTGLLGDTLSYVRLFALGVASAVLGLVVNQIGMQIMGSSWLGIILGVVFLLFGHGLNLALATLGAFVHPLRLTFVEFYNNVQFQGGGIEYQPFRKSV